jgi:hypothetical protein
MNVCNVIWHVNLVKDQWKLIVLHVMKIELNKMIVHVNV